MSKKLMILLGLIFAVGLAFLILMISCQVTPAAETTAAAETTTAETTASAETTAVVAGTDVSACADCHNETTLIKSKQVQWDNSVHATGGNFERSGASCAICHTSEGFTERIAAGAFEIAEDVKDPSPVNCRTCHNIHETYTSDDWALTIADPVTIQLTGDTYDKGNSNLCAQCHQPRIDYEIPKAGGGDIEITSARFGPHHGPQSTMLLGVGGYGEEYKGSSVHYDATENGCISCHMTDAGAFGKQAGGHTWNMAYEFHEEETEYLAGCLVCHEDIETFDRNEVQTEVAAMLEEVKNELIKKGILDGETDLAVPGTYSSELLGALWNYKTVEEDRSMGIHNPGYAKFLLETALEALQ